MIPTVKKLYGDIAEAIRTPGVSAGKLAIGKAGGAARDAARSAGSSKEFDKTIAKIRSRLIPHASDDLGTLAALCEYAYGNLVRMKAVRAGNRMRLHREGKRPYDPESDPTSFTLDFVVDLAAVEAADRDVERQIVMLQRMKPLFKTGFPGCMYALFGANYMDIKGLAGSMTSLMGGDIALVKQVKQKSEWGVEACDWGLTWAGRRDRMVDDWLSAHAAQ